MGMQRRPVFDVVRPEFHRPTLASPALQVQGDMKNGFGKAVVMRDLSEPCVFLSLDSCQTGSQWAAYHGLDQLSLLPVVLVLYVLRV